MINIVVGLVRMKVVAMLLGPAGVGMIGLYMGLVQTASMVAGLGLGNAGTRQIAEAQAEGGDLAVGRTRRALFWGTFALALAGAGIFWAASGWIARVILADQTRAPDVAWLSLGVALTVAAGSQGALLAGMRRIGDLARINMGAGVVGAGFGVLALWLWGPNGIIFVVLAAPAVTFVLGHFYVARLGPPAGAWIRLPELSREWRAMVTLGLAFMLSYLVGQLGQLAARTLVQRELGSEALGQFQASSAIGMTYLGFVLGAMGTDYYPRLTAAIRDHNVATRLVNEQTEVALLLCAPLLLAMLGLTPWVIQLLYSPKFGPAVEILRWQLLGDVLKVLSWPLSYVLLATGAGRTFVITESLGSGVFVLGVVVGLPLIGVTATGMAFLALYVVSLPLVWILGGRRIGFRWTRAVKLQAVAVASAALAVEIAARSSELLGAAVGVGLATVTGIWALMRLSAKADLLGVSGGLVYISERLKAWMVKLR